MTSRARPNPIYSVVTCGLCGQTWQRTALPDGEVLDCIFCGMRGRLALGAVPLDPSVSEPIRIEARLLLAGT